MGVFLGGGVRPLLVSAMKSQPTLVGPILTSMFSRYNLMSLALAAACLTIEILSHRSLATPATAAALTSLIALKLPVDGVIRRREASGQVRREGNEGARLEWLHQAMEKATILIMLLSLVLFVLIVAGR